MLELVGGGSVVNGAYPVYFSIKSHVISEILKMLFLPIFIILSDTEESTTIFLDFYHFRVQRWLNRFVYIKTNCSCCPLNCSSVAAKSPICRSHNTLSSCSTSTSPSAATTSMSGRKQPGAWPCLPAARPCPTPGQQFCLLENSKILILTASVKLKDKHLFSKKGTYCHGQGLKIGLNENFPYFSEIQDFFFF